MTRAPRRDDKTVDLGHPRRVDDDRDYASEADRLPVMKGLIYTYDDETVYVNLGLGVREVWPNVTVDLRQRGRDIRITGEVRPDGAVRALAIEADGQDPGVTGGSVASLAAVVSALKEWAEVARDMAGQILGGVPEDRTVVDAKRATESLRALFYGTRRPPGTRKRGADAELMLRQVVAAYQQAVTGGDPAPRKTVAAQFGYTPEYISRLLKRARQPRNGRPPLLEDPETVRVRRLAAGGGVKLPMAQGMIVAAIVTSDLGVLVGKRNDGKPPWTFIAGEQEPGESPGDTIVREVKEETGLEVRPSEIIGTRVHPSTGRTMIYIAATPTHGTDVFVGDPDELAEVRWVTLAEADELLPGMYGPVREHLARELGEG
jgi:8-oxo-dGTP pyrophosphatase MutT (NUDIX family)